MLFKPMHHTKRIDRIFTLTAALLAALLLLAGCTGSGERPQTTAEPDEGAPGAGVEFSKDEVPGVLLYTGFSLQAGEFTAIALSGDRAGSDGLRAAAPAKEGVRCAFELGENISVTLVTNGVEGEMTFCLAPHREFKDYKHFDSSEAPARSAVKAAPETHAELRLDPASAEAGCYDLLIMSGGRIVGMCYVRVYPEGALSGASDEELTKPE